MSESPQQVNKTTQNALFPKLVDRFIKRDFTQSEVDNFKGQIEGKTALPSRGSINE